MNIFARNTTDSGRYLPWQELPYSHNPNRPADTIIVEIHRRVVVGSQVNEGQAFETMQERHRREQYRETGQCPTFGAPLFKGIGESEPKPSLTANSTTTAIAALIFALCAAGLSGCVMELATMVEAPAPLALDAFLSDDPPCYDRSVQPQTSVIDTHVHFRPFGGPAVPFEKLLQYFEETGVLFANIYGIGQTLPVTSSCTYYLDCPGTPVTPSLKNDFVNAANYVTAAQSGVHLTLSMTFPDLAEPETIPPGIELLETEYPGLFQWMGEVNLVKQALFDNGHTPVSPATISEWAPFMEVLRDRGFPFAVHSDLGSEDAPTLYLPLMEEVLRRYPDNVIVWVHMGLSRELTTMDAARHVELMTALLERYPNLMLDIAWRVLDDAYFSTPEGLAAYVPFLNTHSERILPGTDFLASHEKSLDIYRTELEVTSRINRSLDDDAFRNIALGQNYFRLLGLDYEAPPICP